MEMLVFGRDKKDRTGPGWGGGQDKTRTIISVVAPTLVGPDQQLAIKVSISIESDIAVV